jgi:hypothetical protein
MKYTQVSNAKPLLRRPVRRQHPSPERKKGQSD